MLLSGGWADVTRASCRVLGRRWASGDAASTAVEAHMAGVKLGNGPAVGVVELVHVDVIHCAVVEEVAAIPVAAVVTRSEITEAVVDAVVEADLRAPISGMPDIHAVAPAPPSGSP